ncbi:MAG: HlyD family secretion protein [Alphaproteobacteria bacterium]
MARRRIVFLFLMLVLVGGLAGGGWYWWTTLRFRETTDDAYIVGDITTISPKLAGYVTEVPVDHNQPVAAGDLLVKLDDRDIVARLQVAAARIEEREAAVAVIDRQMAQAEAAIERVQAELRWVAAEQKRIEQDYQRDKQLVGQKVIPTTRFDAISAERQKIAATAMRDEAMLDEAKHNREVLNANRQQALAAIEAAKAEHELAKLDLEHTEIRAPVAGIIGNRSVHAGEYVRPGVALMSVVPLEAVWVEANFKETQIEGMRHGQKVSIEVDAYPDLALEGRIESLSPASGANFSLLPPENATGNFTKIVQRVPVRIALPADVLKQELLRPGLSVVVTADRRDGEAAAEETAQAAAPAAGAGQAAAAE